MLVGVYNRGMQTKPKCTIEGCNNNQVLQGHRKDGSAKYYGLCSSHHKRKYGMSLNKHKGGKEIHKLSLLPCSKCGWNRSFCDRHRIIAGNLGGKYKVGNVISLCPNCHRELHNPHDTLMKSVVKTFRGR
jgi:hypothetical protein